MSTLFIVKTGSTFASIAQTHGDFEDWIAEGLQPPHTLVADRLPMAVIDANPSQPGAVHYPAPEQCAGVVISGSHDMVTECTPWMLALQEWLHSICLAGVPVLGICFGHQLLAQTLGGKVGCHPAGLELGTVPVSVVTDTSEDPLWRGMPPCFDAQTVHFQSVRQLPQGAQLLAGNSHEPHHAFRWRHNVWGVQFHPEFRAPYMQGYIDHVAQDLQRHGSALDMPQLRCSETPESAQLLHNFARYAQQCAGQPNHWRAAA